MSTSLGDKIRELRKKKGYTLEKLAELTESSKSYIWELENKNPPRPSGDKVAQIASVLGVTSDYLLDTTETSNVAEATDQAFFRRYRKMEPATKEKIRAWSTCGRTRNDWRSVARALGNRHQLGAEYGAG